MPAFAFSGGEAHGRALLESALAEPRQTFGGRYLHRTIYDKAAALFRSLVKDHPLYDGNKRLALASLFLFLWLNWIAFYVARDEAVKFALRVASEDVPLREIERWVRRHSVPLQGSKAKRLARLERLVHNGDVFHEALPRARLTVELLSENFEKLYPFTAYLRRLRQEGVEV